MRTSDAVLAPAKLAAVLAAVNAVAMAQAGPPTYFVDDDANWGGDGSSWDTAFRDLQDALDVIARDRPPLATVHLAQGTYTPDRGTGARWESFALTSAVSLIGGFAGIGAANPDANDPARFVSVLSGDLYRNDTPGFGNRNDNSHRVVDVSFADTAARLVGLTIRGGHAVHATRDRGERDLRRGSAGSVLRGLREPVHHHRQLRGARRRGVHRQRLDQRV